MLPRLFTSLAALGLVYSFDQMGFDRTQFDILANIGLSYAIPIW